MNIPVEIDIELLQPGDEAPTFELEDHRGDTFRLGERGLWTLVWWYPQAFGGGCTQCAEAIRAATDELQMLGCEVVGLTYSDWYVNKRFAEKLDFSWPICQADVELAEKWGAAKNETESWPTLPRRLIYLVRPDGVVHQRYLIAGYPKHEMPQILADLRDAQDADLDVQVFTNSEQSTTADESSLVPWYKKLFSRS